MSSTSKLQIWSSLTHPYFIRLFLELLIYPRTFLFFSWTSLLWNRKYHSQNRTNPGESIRPADPVVFDRISSEFDGTRWNPGRIWSDFNHVPSNSDKIRDGIRLKGIRQNSVGFDRNFFDPTGSDPPSVTWENIHYPQVPFSKQNNCVLFWEWDFRFHNRIVLL